MQIAACDESFDPELTAEGLSRIDCGFYLSAEPPGLLDFFALCAGNTELSMHSINQKPACDELPLAGSGPEPVEGSRVEARGQLPACSYGLYVDGSPGGDHDIGNRGDNHSGIV